jgi:hypothetical protein
MVAPRTAKRRKGTMSDTPETSDEGLRSRLTRQGEDAIGKLAQDLLENPLVNSTPERRRPRRRKWRWAP